MNSSFWPEGSRLRLVLRLIKRTALHPVPMLKYLPFRAFFKALRSGSANSAEMLAGYALGLTAPRSMGLRVINIAKTRYNALTLPQYESPIVSIIIPVYNEWAYTHACVQAIIEHSGEIPYEVIIADDASTDETRELETYITGAVHVRNEENLRFLKNCNSAAKRARGKYIVFLNNDTQPQPNWLEPLVRLLDGDESIGLAGSKLIYPSGKLQEAGGIIWNDASGWNYGRFDDPFKPDYNYVKDADYISGAAIIVRKSLWDELGGFDERFAPAYYEDADLAFSIRKKGFRAVYQPLSQVVHFEGISNGTDEASGQKRYQADNKAKFLEKWKDELTGHFPSGEDAFWARDRSRGKKTILFIDQHVPMYDKDAGSRNTYSYVKLCVETGYHVIFLGDNFFPHQPYTGELQQMGVMVLHGTWYRDYWKRWLKQNGGYIDVVYLNRPLVSEVYIDAVKAYTRAKIVYHGVDLHCARIRAQYEAQGDPALLKAADDWERRERALFAKADLILTVSEKEKPVIEAMSGGKPVMVLPIFYFDTYPAAPSFKERRGLLFVGGFAHPPNADAVLWFSGEIMPLLPPDTRLTIVGSKPPPAVQALASERIVIAGYVSDEELERLYRTCRIAVAPLRFGAGVKGKTVEAVYNLIPIVSTSFGIEGLPEAETIIPICDGAESFAKELQRLLSSDEACQSAAAAYRLWIEKWFSKEHAIEVVREMMVY